MKKKLIVPKFKNEAEESAFWAKLDLDEYFEPSDFERGVVFPSLQRSKKLISIRLPQQLLLQVKVQAQKKAIPYQNLIQEYIQRGLHTN